MRLQVVLVQEVSEKVTNGQAESTFEVRNKNNPFTLIRIGRDFITWQPTLDACWDSPRLDQPVDVLLRNPGTLPISVAKPSLGFMFFVRMLLFSLLWVIFILSLTVVGWINA